jgi:hypothetical protein
VGAELEPEAGLQSVVDHQLDGEESQPPDRRGRGADQGNGAVQPLVAGPEDESTGAGGHDNHDGHIRQQVRQHRVVLR